MKHGNYDPEKHLPDNRMQPNDSRLNVWLQEQIIARLGNDQAQDLIQQAAQYKEKRYKWLLDRMKERGHPDLAEEYHKRHLAYEAQRRYAAKERELSRWRERLAEAIDPQYKVYIRNRIIKCEKYLEERKPPLDNSDEDAPNLGHCEFRDAFMERTCDELDELWGI